MISLFKSAAKGLFWCALLLCSMSVKAELIKQLYTHSILVPNQSIEERKSASGKALQQVLIKVSGRADITQAPQVTALTSRAETFLESFHYEPSEELIDYRGQSVQASKLVLRFSGGMLEQLLREYQLPVWPANRPSILIWLVSDDKGARRIATAIEQPGIHEVVDAAGRDLGLPLMSPLFDLQDQVAIDSDSLWRLDSAKILSASKRYQVDSVLVGRYSQTSTGLWLGSWSLEHKGKQRLFDSQGETQEALVAAGLSQVAQYFSDLYAVVASDMPANAVAINVSGVVSFADYLGVIDYLSNLTIVGHVAPLTVKGQQMDLLLYVEGDESVLMSTLLLDRKLEAVKTIDVHTPIVSTGVPAQPVLTGAPALEGVQHFPGSLANPLKFIWSRSGR